MKTTYYFFLLLGAFIVLTSGCKTLQSLQTKDISKMEPRIEMFKGPCFGSCPVYTLKVYDGGIVVYEGQRFTDKIGTHRKLIETSKYKALIKEFESANLWSYQNAYKAQIPDLPTVTITYREEGEEKKIKGKDGRPEKIIELEEKLTAIADSGGWGQSSGGDNYGMPSDIIADELIVNLISDTDPYAWIIKFSKQDMQIVKRLSPNSPYWLFSFSPDRVSPNEMLEMVRRDPSVHSAEFNQRVNGLPRN